MSRYSLSFSFAFYFKQFAILECVEVFSISNDDHQMRFFDFTLHHQQQKVQTQIIEKFPRYENGTQRKLFGNDKRNLKTELRYMLVCCAHFKANPLKIPLISKSKNLLKGTARSRYFFSSTVVQIWKMCMEHVCVHVHIIFISKWLDRNQATWDWLFVFLLLPFALYVPLAVGWR